MRHFAKHLRILAIGSVASIAFIGHGVAQDAQDSSLEESYQGRNDIIVTATRRSESVLDVPISIAVLTADEIGKRGLVSAEDYLRGIPGVNQTSDPVGSSIIIRGLETSRSEEHTSELQSLMRISYAVF